VKHRVGETPRTRRGERRHAGAKRLWAREAVAALKIDIGQITRVDRKGSALKRPPLLIDQATGVLIRAAQEWASKDQFATTAATDTFTLPQRLLLSDIVKIDGTQQESSNLIGQLADDGGSTRHELPQPEPCEGWKRNRHMQGFLTQNMGRRNAFFYPVGLR
jgi:hypothetical protein